jgi:site-specific DNA-adenine methylase
MYNKLKAGKPRALRCFIGSVASFKCFFFTGHFRKPIHGRQDYYRQAVEKLEKWRNPMKKVIFLKSRSYSDFNPHGYLIYCDPPYRSCKLGNLWKKFDSDTFWETMRIWSKNNLVFVSEKEAPQDFVPIETFHSHLNEKKYIEYLFIHRDIVTGLYMSKKLKKK